MLVNSAVVRRFLGEIGDIKDSQIRRQQHFHLHPIPDAEPTVGSSIFFWLFLLKSIYGFFPLCSLEYEMRRNCSADSVVMQLT